VCLRRWLLRWQRRAAQALKAPPITRRLDYRPPAWLVERVELHFELDAGATTVRSRLSLCRNPRAPEHAPLELDGRELELVEVRLDGRALPESEYRIEPGRLIVPNVPAHACLEITTRVRPAANTALEGLYQSGQMLCTQCEAHGFSRITYFPDRPDVMARYRVTLSADRSRYPVLLANGNPVAAGNGGNGRHWVTWEDPFPKPCYLFALVAGDLSVIEDGFVTRLGRQVTLRIYVEPENRERCAHAMTSLKQAMRWDEEAYGREYDLELFMIVAAGSFNMGAMENKGLNIFNARYIVADPETATDDDLEAVRDIIGHEYFHNWTGNRITCRDWFQLSVKESLTVFREQQFSEAMGSPAIARIHQARLIRSQQFPEDAGPTAHPVRPDSYMEVNNLYTLTVYEKGAEVIRMVHTLLGPERFRRGMDFYFERHDGQAVTVEDFLDAMEDASGCDLSQFRLWYSQAGTPVVKAQIEYDESRNRYVLELEQSCPATPGQPQKQPLHIPLRLALVDPSGCLRDEQMVEFRTAKKRLIFEGVPGPCALSLLRGFSAPVRIVHEAGDAQLRQLILHSGDAYARWDAVQQLYLRWLAGAAEACRGSVALPPADELAQSLRQLLVQQGDPALLAEMLQLPGEMELADQLASVDPDAVVAARDGLRYQLGERLYPEMQTLHDQLSPRGRYVFDVPSVARRRLRNACLGWLLASRRGEARAIGLGQYRTADNMTDALGALTALNDHDCPERDEALAHFRECWQGQPLVLDKWLSLQAVARIPGTVERVRSLLGESGFDRLNPNRIRALLGSFAHHNFRGFHRADGTGYALVAEQVESLDRVNPQVAARLAAAFTRWRRIAGARREQMKTRLEHLRSITGLSPDVLEIVSKSLDSG
jgi:aminopeptidase N